MVCIAARLITWSRRCAPIASNTKSSLVATRGLRLRGGWVDSLSLLDSLQYLAGYLVHFAPSNSLLRIKEVDSESSNHPTGSASYDAYSFGSDKYGDLPF